MTDFTGAFAYQNWRAFLAAQPALEANEVALHSDSRFEGQLLTELEPYQLINTVPYADAGELRIALVLRSAWHVGFEREHILDLMKVGKTDLSRFHGGSAYDEVTALISLIHGVRLHAGAIIRTFYPSEGPRGRPEADNGPVVVLPTRRTSPVLPFFARQVSLKADLLSTYPRLRWPTAGHILRSARSYQQAVWIADSDPNLAWLMLVSAVETAAVEWDRIQKASALNPAALLREADSSFYQEIAEAAGERKDAVATVVGRHLAGTLRSRFKFNRFLLTFLPAPPERRPVAALRVEWTEESLSNAFDVIYAYRSKALHESLPFPPPMCNPPMIGDIDQDGVVTAHAERPTSTEFTHGGLFTREGLPMHLFLFAHIVQQAVVGFWEWAAKRHSESP